LIRRKIASSKFDKLNPQA